MKLNHKLLKFTKLQIEKFNQIGIQDTSEILNYYPIRYIEISFVSSSLWKMKEKIFLIGKVVTNCSNYSFARNRSIQKFQVLYDDQYFQISLFNRPWASKQIVVGKQIFIQGVYEGKNKITCLNYSFDAKIDQQIEPVYSLKGGFTQKVISSCVDKVLKTVEIDNVIPSSLTQHYRLLTLQDAYHKIHQPQTMEDVRQAIRTLKYVEFLDFFTAMMLVKNEKLIDTGKVAKKIDTTKINALIQAQPFSLTKDQSLAIQDILRDMSSEKLMYRLIQGDVGCGKTFVAICAMYGCVLSGYQCALLAPTEILAKQHYETVTNTLKNTSIRIEVLYSSLSARQKEDVLDRLRDGKIDILIGTHSIIQDDVLFSNLGLVIADEQHRFGVNQRKALKEKGKFADFLLMSATPIPRTLASTLFGDMDISTIYTMPASRKPVITKLIKENSMKPIVNEVQGLLQQGRQIYVICPSIDEGEQEALKNVNQIYKSLTVAFRPYQVGLLHGKMTSKEKDEVMHDFASNKIQILVSTTVVEVGVNVVNATGMIIYNSDRYGLSQIHQLRGRVQRGSHEGHCWLLTDNLEDKALERLNVLTSTSDGFQISYEDLRLRGPGDILGTRQSGLPDFVLANPIFDTKMIEAARNDAKMVVENENKIEFSRYILYVKYKNSDNITYID